MPVQQCRIMAGTLNNPTDEEIQIFRTVDCKRIIAGMEKGEAGTPHIQFAITWRNPISFAAAKALLCPRVHLEKAKKVWAANFAYCIKEGNILRDHDESRGQGTRTDLEYCNESMKRSSSMAELLDNHLDVVAKYPKFVSLAREVYDKKNAQAFRNVEVIVHWGDAGTGKSRPAFEDGAYAVASYSPEWWDGYDGENVVLFDDFYGQIKLSRMLRLLDGYPVQVPCKGSFRYLTCSRIYITSNAPPEEWFPNCPQASKDGLMRRISRVVHFGG